MTRPMSPLVLPSIGSHWALDAEVYVKGCCLGKQGIVLAINNVRCAILAKGYITSRVMAQDLITV